MVREVSLRKGISRRAKLHVERLEDRLAPATITVTTNADETTANDGVVSLREAISAINAQQTTDNDILAQLKLNQTVFGTNDTVNFTSMVQRLLARHPRYPNSPYR
jgi:CSLREA domain-containing protein